MTLRRSGWVAALLALVLAGVVGCGPAADQAETRAIVVGATAAPDSLDPTTASASAIPEVLLYNVYETLLKINSEGDLVPLLAKEWAISEDRMTVTFTLQENAVFSTGTPVNADAVVASITRIQNDPKVLAVYKDYMKVVTSVVAQGEHTVVFTLAHPSNNWLFRMAESAGIIFEPNSFENLASQPVGSGPFAFDSWVQGDSVSLVRNDSYWATPSTLPGVTFRYYDDPNAENAAMLSGSLDIVSNVAAPQALDQFSDVSRFTVLDGVTTGEIVMGFNHQSPALQDLRVRQAINYGIDRQALRDAVWAGHGPLIGSMVATTDPWYEDLSGYYTYDPDKAKALLADAGVNDLTLRLRVPTLPYATGAATYIASQLAEIGITVQVDELEFPATWIDEVMTKSNYDMTIVSHTESRDINRWANPDYYWHYDNPEFQALIAAADLGDEQTQIDSYQRAARILAEDAAASFLWLLPHIVVTKADIVGVSGNAPSLSFDLTQAAIKAA